MPSGYTLTIDELVVWEVVGNVSRSTGDLLFDDPCDPLLDELDVTADIDEAGALIMARVADGLGELLMRGELDTILMVEDSALVSDGLLADEAGNMMSGELSVGSMVPSTGATLVDSLLTTVSVGLTTRAMIMH